MGVIVIPTLAVWLTNAFWLLRVLEYIVIAAIFVVLYIVGYKYARVEYKDAFLETKVQRSAILKNESKIKRIIRSIKKDKDDERYGYFYIYNPERVETSCLNATIYQVSFYIHSEEYADWTKNNILVNGINFYGMNIDDVKAAMAPLTTSSSGPYLVFNDGDYTYLITLGADGLVEEVEIELNFSKSFDQI